MLTYDAVRGVSSHLCLRRHYPNKLATLGETIFSFWNPSSRHLATKYENKFSPKKAALKSLLFYGYHIIIFPRLLLAQSNGWLSTNSIRNYHGWTDFLCMKTLMISMKPIQVGIVRSIIGKYIPLKTVTIRPDGKPWMDNKVHLAVRRWDHLLRIHNIRLSSVTWESYRVQRNIVTFLIRFC